MSEIVREVYTPKDPSDLAANLNVSIQMKSMQLLHILDSCLEKNILKSRLDSQGNIRKSEDRVSPNVIAILEPMLHQSTREILPIPDGYDLELRAKQLLIGVVKVLHQDEVLPLALIMKATKIIGTDNIRILDGYENGTFNIDKYGNEFHTSPRYRIVQSREERNKYISLDIGTVAVQKFATEIMFFAQNKGISMDVQTAFDYALVRIIAHEFGHGVEFSLCSPAVTSLKDTYKKYLKERFPELSGSDVLIYEHFPRALEQYVTSAFLFKEAGFPLESVDLFWKLREQAAEPIMLGIKQLLDQNQMLNFSGLEITLSAIAKALKVWGVFEKYEKLFSNLRSVYQYLVPPMPLELVKQMAWAK